MIKQIAHVCFSSKDLQKTVAFYKEHFSSEVIHEFRNDKGELYGVFLSIPPNARLEFFQSQEMIASGNQFRHFCLEVDDINSLAQKFSAKGFKVEIRRGKTDATLQFWIEDPNGIRIEFQQYDEQSLLQSYSE